MNTSHNTLLAYIVERVDYFEQRYALKRRGQAFMLWYGVEALELDEDEAFAAIQVDGPNDKGIDFFYVDDENESVVIAQGKFDKQGTFSARPGDLYELVHSISFLQNPETLRRDGRADLAELAMDYAAAMGKGYTVDFHYVYMGPHKRDITDAAAQYNADFDTAPNRFARVVDLDTLQQNHDEYIDAASRIAEAKLTLNPNAVFAQDGSFGRSLVATLSGTELKRLYDEYRDTLFDRNVRLYLGARKGSVNAGIRETLNSADERRNFWAYNNGITFVCDGFDYNDTTGELSVRKFSIVNGCQTTVSIATSPDMAPEDVNVLARFIAAPDSFVVDSIIKYNNSQTKIRDWDLTSQDQAQKGLKNRLAEDPHPFFYQLRQGEWSHLTYEEKQRFTNKNGKQQVIKPDVLAQRLAAFKGMPVTAYKDKGTLFTSLGRTIFPQDLRAEEALLAWLAGEAADEIVTARLQEAQQNNERLPVRILTRGGKLFVLAVMAILLEARNGSAYLTRIKRDVAGSNNTRRDLATYATLALSYYTEIMEDRVEEGHDVSLMVRSEESFGRVRSKVRTKWDRESISADWLKAIPKMA